jgi:hypothetical protein
VIHWLLLRKGPCCRPPCCSIPRHRSVRSLDAGRLQAWVMFLDALSHRPGRGRWMQTASAQLAVAKPSTSAPGVAARAQPVPGTDVLVWLSAGTCALLIVVVSEPSEAVDSIGGCRPAECHTLRHSQHAGAAVSLRLLLIPIGRGSAIPSTPAALVSAVRSLRDARSRGGDGVGIWRDYPKIEGSARALREPSDRPDDRGSAHARCPVSVASQLGSRAPAE